MPTRQSALYPQSRTDKTDRIQCLAVSHQTVIDDYLLAFIDHLLHPCLHRKCKDRELGLGEACLEPLLLDVKRLEK